MGWEGMPVWEMYGSLWPLRLLEEIRFWKIQEREHTVVIQTLGSNLPPKWILRLQEWGVAFGKLEGEAVQLLERVARQGYVDPETAAASLDLARRSVAQSVQFIRLLGRLPLPQEPVFATVINHIKNESEYFLGVMTGVLR